MKVLDRIEIVLPWAGRWLWDLLPSVLAFYC